jgi:glycosyltransferase involved in cell wall biosynthesis
VTDQRSPTIEPSPPLRILGLSAGRGNITTATALLLEIIAQRNPLAGSIAPELNPVADLLIKLRHFDRDRATWRARAGFSETNFRALSGAVERELRRRRGTFEVIFQAQTVFAPGDLREARPFVVYTDNIISLTQRFYPAWARLSPAGFRRWRELETEVLRAAAHVFPWSDFVREAMIDDYGLDPSRVSSVGAGVNLLMPTLESRRWDSARALFVGRDFARKGGHELLGAWAHVRRALPDARLTVVGPPRAPDGADLTGVDWLGAVESQAELRRLYEEASVFVMPSLFEPWGHVFLEAMGCGLPCIGAAHCAMPETIADGETGLLVPPGEVEPLAAALERLLGDPPLAEQYGRRAHASMLSGKRWSDVADRIVPALESAIERPAPQPALSGRGVPARLWPGGRARFQAPA